MQITNRNLGDTLIADNTRKLIKKAFSFKKRKNVVIIDYPISCRDLDVLKFVDAIVFAGGGLIKFRNEQHYNHTIAITNKAEELNIPVFFNAVGVEGYDESDERCLALKNAINSPCVKGITVRDDVETLKKYYIENQSIVVKSVFDPAVFSTGSFEKARKSEVIGLGVARGELFTDYGNEKINREYLLDFWKNVAKEIEKQGREWAVFTNGLEGDEAFATEVLEYIGYGKKCNAPADSAQLIETITQFKSIIASRMHSCIVAHTYRVPCIGLVWNDKLSLWGEKIGHEERFILPENMSAEKVVAELFSAEQNGVNKINKKEKKQTAECLKIFLRNYAEANVGYSRNVDFSKYMVATALGGDYLKYKNMNSLSTIGNSLENGYKWLEADLRLSEDKELVCVNGWSEATYKQLGVSFNENKKRMTSEEFLKQKYYNKYKTTSFEMLVEYISTRKTDGIKLVLDIGKPTRAQFKVIVKSITESLKKFGCSTEDFILKIHNTELYEELECANFYFEVMLVIDFSKDEKDTEEKLLYCKNKIKYVSIDKNLLSSENVKRIKDYELRIAVFSYKNITDILNAIDSGADLVGSLYYTPWQLNELIN